MGYSRVQTEPFRVDEVLADLRDARSGGTTVYVGSVRGHDEGRRVDALHYEAYPAMAEKELEALRLATMQRFGLVDAIVIHRVGRFTPGDPVLVVALSGAHRKETFAAIDHFMDRLKELVPIWKQEHGPDGAAWILGAENQRVST